MGHLPPAQYEELVEKRMESLEQAIPGLASEVEPQDLTQEELDAYALPDSITVLLEEFGVERSHYLDTMLSVGWDPASPFARDRIQRLAR